MKGIFEDMLKVTAGMSEAEKGRKKEKLYKKYGIKIKHPYVDCLEELRDFGRRWFEKSFASQASRALKSIWDCSRGAIGRC